jgi:hypothetical protein
MNFVWYFGAAYLAHGLGSAILARPGVFFLIVFALVGVGLIDGMSLIQGLYAILGVLAVFGFLLLVTGNWIVALVIWSVVLKVSEWFPEHARTETIATTAMTSTDWTWVLTWEHGIIPCVVAVGVKCMLQPYFKRRQEQRENAVHVH